MTSAAPHSHTSQFPKWIAATALGLAIMVFEFARGGFDPAVWGWFGLAAFCISGSLILTGRGRVGRGQVVFLGVLAGIWVWELFSLLWADEWVRPILEFERTCLYFGVCMAIALSSHRLSSAAIIRVMAVAIAVVDLYALLHRALPGVFGADVRNDHFLRLSDPLGYWNALGGLTAMGIVLSLSLVCAQTLGPVGNLGAGLPVQCVVLYLTFGRGSLLAAGVGIVVLVAGERYRGRAIACLVVVCASAALPIVVASQSDGIIRSAPEHIAIVNGVISISVSAVAAALCLWGLQRPVIRQRGALPAVRMRTLVFAGIATAGAVVVIGTISDVSPRQAVISAASDFTSGDAVTVGNNDRLLSLSSNRRIDYWSVAWEAYIDHPVLGIGAGEWEVRWLRYRPYPLTAEDAQ